MIFFIITLRFRIVKYLTCLKNRGLPGGLIFVKADEYLATNDKFKNKVTV